MRDHPDFVPRLSRRQHLGFAAAVAVGSAAVLFLISALYLSARRDEEAGCDGVTGEYEYQLCLHRNEGTGPYSAHLGLWLTAGVLLAVSGALVRASGVRRLPLRRTP